MQSPAAARRRPLLCSFTEEPVTTPERDGHHYFRIVSAFPRRGRWRVGFNPRHLQAMGRHRVAVAHQKSVRAYREDKCDFVFYSGTFDDNSLAAVAYLMEQEREEEEEEEGEGGRRRQQQQQRHRHKPGKLPNRRRQQQQQLADGGVHEDVLKAIGRMMDDEQSAANRSSGGDGVGRPHLGPGDEKAVNRLQKQQEQQPEDEEEEEEAGGRTGLGGGRLISAGGGGGGLGRSSSGSRVAGPNKFRTRPKTGRLTQPARRWPQRIRHPRKKQRQRPSRRFKNSQKSRRLRRNKTRMAENL